VRYNFISEKCNEQSKIWYQLNSEKHKERSRNWQRKNPDKIKAINKTWLENNRDKANARTGRRRACKLQQTPVWSNNREILKFYKESLRLTKETGIPHHVDHIIPLRGEFVSGLHVPNNLQVIPASDNCKKNNKFEDI
jgi:hypothetical protein